MKPLARHRQQFELSGERIRRARRLWRRLIKPSCENAKGSQLIRKVRQARDRGLFSAKTYDYDIAHACLIAFCKMDYGRRAKDMMFKWRADHGWMLGTLDALRQTG